MKTSEAIVVWFNKFKEYGEVEMPDGSQAFLHLSAIGKAPKINDKLKVKVYVSPKDLGLVKKGDLIVWSADFKKG